MCIIMNNLNEFLSLESFMLLLAPGILYNTLLIIYGYDSSINTHSLFILYLLLLLDILIDPYFNLTILFKAM